MLKSRFVGVRLVLSGGGVRIVSSTDADLIVPCLSEHFNANTLTVSGKQVAACDRYVVMEMLFPVP